MKCILVLLTSRDSGELHCPVSALIYEPRHKNNCLRDLRPGKTQTGHEATEASLRLEISDIETRDITLSRRKQERC